jgi:hypothetical protein
MNGEHGRGGLWGFGRVEREENELIPRNISGNVDVFYTSE